MAEFVELSLVVPMYNEEAVIDLFLNRSVPILTSITHSYEIICVNDGSNDRTLERLLQARSGNPRIKVLNLSRNFGKEAALTAGIDHARGQAIIPIDADLQHQPELITDMVAKWRDGFDVVIAVRSNRKRENFPRKFTANAFYWVMAKLSEVPIPSNASDFRLMDRRVVDALRQFPERTRFMKGIFAWLGFRQAIVSYVPPPRAAGVTKWRYWKLWNFALEGITSFTSLPLRIWTYIGVLTAMAALIYAFYITLKTVIYGVDVPGYASIIVILLFFNGMHMFSTGIIGEYLARVFIEVKRRPLYLVRDRYGLCEPAERIKDKDR